MKYIIMTFGCALMLLMCGCRNFMFSHNANMLADGKYTHFGVGDYGLTYGDGLLITQAVRENSEMVIQTNHGGDFGNPSANLKGVRSVCFRTGPQVTGYLVDLAEKDTEAAKSYVEKMQYINNAQWGDKQTSSLDQSKSNKKEGGDKVSTIKGALSKLKKDGVKIPIDGDGEYTGLWKDTSIAYQAALATKLMACADDAAKMPNTGELLKDTLVHYQGRLAMLAAKGKTESKLIQIDRATVKDGKLTYLMYRVTYDGQKPQDEECPSCHPLEE